MSIKKLYVTVALGFISGLFSVASAAVTVTPLESGIKVSVTSNSSNNLKTSVSEALTEYNEANGTSYSTSNITDLTVGGKVSYWLFDLSSLNINMLTGNLDDDLSFIWSLRSSLVNLDMSNSTMVPNLQLSDEETAVNTVLQTVVQSLNILPPYAFWRGADIDTDMLPDASNRLVKRGMTKLETISLPSNLIGLNQDDLTSLATTIKDYMVDNNVENETVKTALNTLLDVMLSSNNIDFFGGVGDYALAYATSLKSVTIPGRGELKIGTLSYQGVRSIGKKAFYHDDALETVTFGQSKTLGLFGSNVSNFKTIGKQAFAYSGLTTVTIPAETEIIGEEAFRNCTSLASVNVKYGEVLENNLAKKKVMLTTISSGAFENCTALSSFVFDNSSTPLETVGSSAFENCSALTDIKLPSTVTSIESKAFKSTGLEAMVLPESLTTLGDESFSDCSALNYFVIDGAEGELSLGRMILRNTVSMTAEAGGILWSRRLTPPTGTAVGSIPSMLGTFVSLGKSGVLYYSPVNVPDSTLQLSIPFISNEWSDEAESRYEAYTGHSVSSYSSDVATEEVVNAYYDSSLWKELIGEQKTGVKELAASYGSVVAVSSGAVTFNADVNVTISTVAGIVVKRGAFTAGTSISLPSGVYVMKLRDQAITMKINI